MRLSSGFTLKYYLYTIVFLLHFYTHAGLAVPVVGVNAFATARDIVDKVVTVR